jgi:hypothetical protein
MKTIKGHGLFPVQFKGATPLFNNLDTIAGSAASLDLRGVQLSTGTRGFVDLEQAAGSQGYCDVIREMLAGQRWELTELSIHMQGQLSACHPTYDALFDDFATPELRGRSQVRQQWATRQLLLAARASRRFGLKAHVTFPGALAWPYFYPWPQRTDRAFDDFASSVINPELNRRSWVCEMSAQRPGMSQHERALPRDGG